MFYCYSALLQYKALGKLSKLRRQCEYLVGCYPTTACSANSNKGRPSAIGTPVVWRRNYRPTPQANRADGSVQTGLTASLLSHRLQISRAPHHFFNRGQSFHSSRVRQVPNRCFMCEKGLRGALRDSAIKAQQAILNPEANVGQDGDSDESDEQEKDNADFSGYEI